MGDEILQFYPHITKVYSILNKRRKSLGQSTEISPEYKEMRFSEMMNEYKREENEIITEINLTLQDEELEFNEGEVIDTINGINMEMEKQSSFFCDNLKSKLKDISDFRISSADFSLKNFVICDSLTNFTVDCSLDDVGIEMNTTGNESLALNFDKGTIFEDIEHLDSYKKDIPIVGEYLGMNLSKTRKDDVDYEIANKSVIKIDRDYAINESRNKEIILFDEPINIDVEKNEIDINYEEIEENTGFCGVVEKDETTKTEGRVKEEKKPLSKASTNDLVSGNTQKSIFYGLAEFINRETPSSYKEMKVLLEKLKNSQ